MFDDVYAVTRPSKPRYGLSPKERLTGPGFETEVERAVTMLSPSVLAAASHQTPWKSESSRCSLAEDLSAFDLPLVSQKTVDLQDAGTRGYRPVDTLAFSSSNQFSIRLMCVTGGSDGKGRFCATKNRWPSGAMS